MDKSFTLGSVPLSGRILLSLFLALIGFGYLSALGNLYHRHNMADGEEGLTVNDLRANFHGIEVAAEPSGRPAVAKSHMLEMIEPGGKMRKHATQGGPEAIRTLETWLQRGANEAEFAQEGLTQPGDPAPAEVIMAQCLDCHNADGGEKADVPFGPDLFTVDYQMVWEVARPGTAISTAQTRTDAEPEIQAVGPQSLPHLFLVTHIHMLSIPLFTLIVSGLFLVSAFPARVRNIVAPLPMAVLVLDFSSWWLARQAETFIYVIAAAGALYGVLFGLQLITVFVSMWLPRRAEPAD
jgi:hypothetical protein